MNWVKTALFLIGSAVLTRLIPFSSFFRSLDTMVHEFGHALVTLALSGQVMYIELFANHSGLTYTRVMNNWSQIPISLSGYITASLFAVFLFKLRARDKHRLGLQLITLVATISLVLFVRNEYGMMWLIGFILLNIIMLALMPRWLSSGYYLLLAFLTLEESVLGPISLIVYAWENPAAAGDATNLAELTAMPAIAWAVLFTLFALGCAKSAIQALSGGRKRTRTPNPAMQYDRRIE
ncbi:M50 family metallopeptidase [Paenibacillus xerothermodurans]|uniref:M50 family peptidase n=1 Tax=Paenibacillus xerothermodurans TaxID=1977292 RepID=A0A2W1NUG9_PAEXE|nr:M50 family metallopeptidase [Paenibacillus xerothermodurans]PZE19322.1 M50 family peptidase [Paenibacillus xerothermodurans]